MRSHCASGVNSIFQVGQMAHSRRSMQGSAYHQAGLEYYRQTGVIPYTALRNKIFFKEEDIHRILINNLIPARRWQTIWLHITRKTEEFRELRKKLTQALRLVERLIKEQVPSIFNEVYLTGEEIRSMFGISKRSLQTYRDEHVIPYTMLGRKFLYPQSAIFEVLELISEKPCDEVSIRVWRASAPPLHSHAWM